MSITVVIPTIEGRKELLQRAIASVEAQTRQPDVLIVEPDPQRLGAAATRNRALQDVATEWVAFLDDDDTFYPHHLELLEQVALQTGADLVYPWYDGINSFGILITKLNGCHVSPFGVRFGSEQREHLLTKANFIPICVLVRTELIQQVGGFSPPPWADETNPCEDWGCWIKLLDAGAIFAHVPEITWTWRASNHTSGRGLVTVR